MTKSQQLLLFLASKGGSLSFRRPRNSISVVIRIDAGNFFIERPILRGSAPERIEEEVFRAAVQLSKLVQPIEGLDP